MARLSRVLNSAAVAFVLAAMVTALSACAGSTGLQKVSQSEVVENGDVRVQVVSARLAKDPGSLLVAEPSWWWDASDGSAAEAMTEGNVFIDGHVYLEVDVSLENTSEEEIELALASLYLQRSATEEELKDQGSANWSGGVTVAELALTSESPTSQGDKGHLVIAAHDEHMVTFGYVLTEDEFVELEDDLYVLPGFFGMGGGDQLYLVSLDSVEVELQ